MLFCAWHLIYPALSLSPHDDIMITSTLTSDSASEELVLFSLPLTISRDPLQRNPVVETKITFENYLVGLSSNPGLTSLFDVDYLIY